MEHTLVRACPLEAQIELIDVSPPSAAVEDGAATPASRIEGGRTGSA